MTDSPFPFSSLSDPLPGVLTQEVVTYLKKDNTVVKITVKRDFTKNDYTDSMTTEVIYTW